MLIRLILPICSGIKGNPKKYSNNSLNIQNRIKMLQHAMSYKGNNIELVATSNNFFKCDKISHSFILNKLNKLKNKKNLLIGIDFPKTKNPYNGIPTKVFSFYSKNNKYNIDRYIWEVWNPNVKRNKSTFHAFKKQNRIITIKNKSITLLSCGDILSKVHKSGQGLPDSDIYISLAHLDFTNYYINKRRDISWIQSWKGNEKIVIVTQQLTIDKLKNKHFFENKQYKLLYPSNVFDSQKIYMFQKSKYLVKTNPDYIFIDIKV